MNCTEVASEDTQAIKDEGSLDSVSPEQATPQLHPIGLRRGELSAEDLLFIRFAGC